MDIQNGTTLFSEEKDQSSLKQTQTVNTLRTQGKGLSWEDIESSEFATVMTRKMYDILRELPYIESDKIIMSARREAIRLWNEKWDELAVIPDGVTDIPSWRSQQVKKLEDWQGEMYKTREEWIKKFLN